MTQPQLPPPGAGLRLNNDDVTRALVPIGRAPSAIAAGYLGLLSPAGVFAPFPLVAGVWALRALRRDPSLHGAGRAWFGIVMGALFSALYAYWFGAPLLLR